MNLMIVESPNKVKKIEGILDSSWKVLATAGHFRDLPIREMGIDLSDFSLSYEYLPDVTANGRTYSGGKERISRIRKAMNDCDHIFLATDPDREGEAIAWHIYESLQLNDNQYSRVTFTEITEKAIKEALNSPRKIDFSLVRAQEARRAVDRLVGYTVSPLISDKAGMSLSAGRVQSVALKLVVELEEVIQQFKKQKHFGVQAVFNDKWSAQWDSSPFVNDEIPYILDEAFAKKVAEAKKFKVIESERKLRKKNAPSAFSTSLLLQFASSKLKFNPKKTTQLAQRLFEQGHITYIRTDSVNFADEAISEIRLLAQKNDWPIPSVPNKFKSKESAQEAHEAIRPTHFEHRELGANADEKALYKLIWERSVASQLDASEYEDNVLQLVTEDLAEQYTFKAKGSLLVKKGWQVLIIDEEQDASENKVPLLAVDTIISGSCSVQNKETQPPKRYTEASLVKKLEALGVGRPATFASIINTITDKSYVAVDSKSILTPTKIGIQLVKLLIDFGFMEYSFTASVEDYLDEIAESKNEYSVVVSAVYRQLETEIETLKANDTFKPLHSCNQCSSALRLIKSKKGGLFWVCTNEECKSIAPDFQGKPLPDQECPNCKHVLRRFKRKDSSVYFWSCSNENCKTFLEDKNGIPVPKKTYPCPKCKAELVKVNRKDKSGTFWICQNQECKLMMDDYRNKPIQDNFPPCPKCSEPLYKRNGKFGLYWNCPSCKNNIKIKGK